MYDVLLRLRVMPPELRLRDSSIQYFVEQDIRTYLLSMLLLMEATNLDASDCLGAERVVDDRQIPICRADVRAFVSRRSRVFPLNFNAFPILLYFRLVLLETKSPTLHIEETWRQKAAFSVTSSRAGRISSNSTTTAANLHAPTSRPTRTSLQSTSDSTPCAALTLSSSLSRRRGKARANKTYPTTRSENARPMLLRRHPAKRSILSTMRMYSSLFSRL